MDISGLPAGDGFKKYSFLLFPLLILIIYLSFPTKDFYWDGIIYSKFIEESPSFDIHLLHPNHLFYNGLGYLAFHAAQNIGLATRAIYVLQFLTIIFSVLSAGVFYEILKSLTRSAYLNLTITALMAFSAAWWRFSTDADVYLISIFFLLVSFYFLLPGQLPRPLLVAALHSLAMFFHELAVLFFPVAVLGLIFQTVSLENRKRIFIVLQYGVVAFLLTFGTFCLGFYLLTGMFDVHIFEKWLTSFAPVPGFSFNAWESLRLTIRGDRQFFIDGSSKLFDRNLMTVALLIIFVAAAAFLLFQIGRNVGEIKIWLRAALEEKFYRQPTFALCLAWILPYLLFLFFFIPENTFYRLFYFPPLILLLATILAPFETLKQRRHWRLASLVIALCLYNFLFYIYPNSRVRENTPLALALRANQVWTAKTTVFYQPVSEYDTLNEENRLIKYFNPAVVWKPLNFITLEEFKEEIKSLENAGGDVWLDSSAIKQITGNPQTAQWLADNFNQTPNSELSIPKLNMRFAEFNPK